MKKGVLALVSCFFSSLYANTSINSELRLRLGFESEGAKRDSLAIGAKANLDLNLYKSIDAKLAFVTSQKLFNKDSANSINFFSSQNSSYTIMQEAYLNYSLDDTNLKVGRVILDTPFADSDDIGMVANSFEAISLDRKLYKSLELDLLYIRSISGIDANKPQEFNKIDGGGLYATGFLYEYSDALSIDLWYYHFLSGSNYTYIDTNYGFDYHEISFELSLEYANESFKESSDSDIYGASFSSTLDRFTLFISYDKSRSGVADNGLGGGPFLSSMEFLTIADGKEDADMINTALSYDLDDMYQFCISLGRLSSGENENSKELDLSFHYKYSKDLSYDLIYANVDDTINSDRYKNLRFFINYNF